MAAHTLPFLPVPVTVPHFSQILVPIDFSDASLLALERAIDMARVYQSSLVLAHIASYRTQTILGGLVHETVPRAELEPQDDLDNLRRMTADRGIPCSIIVRKGQILEQIREIIRQEGIDLLVLATHGHRKVSGGIPGSTAEDLLRRTSIPVLTISPVHPQPSWDGKGPRHILFAGNFSPETLCGLSLALGIQQTCGAKLSIVEAVPPGSRRLEIQPVRERIESVAPHGTEIHLIEGPVASTVCTLARELGADLIALGVHRSSLARELFGTALFEMLMTAPCPVLSVRQCDE